MKKKILLMCLLLIRVAFPAFSIERVIINEFLASNSNFIFDPDFERDGDWIELYNIGTTKAVLNDYYLSDNPDNPLKWKIPEGTEIPANGFLLLWADGRNTGLHTNFQLDIEGEFLGLSRQHYHFIDSVNFSQQRTNISFGRDDGNVSQWVFYQQPTPGKANTSKPYSGFAQKPQFSIQGGFFTSSQQVSISSPQPDALIYYSTDGTEPGDSCKFYKHPVNVDFTSVIRAKCYLEGYLPSKSVNHTYFINEPERILPVISLYTAPEHLWDSTTGMFIKYEEDLEKPMGIEFFDEFNNREFALNAGSEVYGSATRKYAQKSIEIKMKNLYGAETLNYKLFPRENRDNFKTFLLRNSGNDWTNQHNCLGTMFCDALQQEIVNGQMDLDMQLYRPSVVYLNGQYWGLYNIREKLDDHYIEYYHGVDADSMDMIKLCADENYEIPFGDSIHMQNLVEYVKSHDMTLEENYEFLKTQIDIDEFINFYIAQIFNANIDWPNNNNKFWRPQKPNGKWRWMLYDLDFGFNGFRWTTYPNWEAYSKNMYGHLEISANDMWAAEIWRNVIDNKDFINEFAQRYMHLLNTTYEKNRLLDIMYEIQKTIEPEMPRHVERWQNQGGLSSMSDWWGQLIKLAKFAELRTENELLHLKEQFNLKSMRTVHIQVHPFLGGQVKVHEIPLQTENLRANYFAQIPLRLSALPNKGYAFSGWTGDVNSENDTLIVFPENVQSIIARFEPQDDSLLINEICASNNSLIYDNFREFDDWIEIHNTTESDIDLGGLFLTDNYSQPFKWQIPENDTKNTLIPPEGYLLFWLDGQFNQGSNHANFKLDKEGEQIALVKKMGDEPAFIDSFSFQQQPANHSYGRYPNASSNFSDFPQPTPRKYNTKPTAIEDVSQNRVLKKTVLYPNPARDKIFIRMDKPGYTQIYLYNLQGKLLQQNQSDNSLKTLNLTQLLPGIYWVKIVTKNQIINRKFIKQ